MDEKEIARKVKEYETMLRSDGHKHAHLSEKADAKFNIIKMVTRAGLWYYHRKMQYVMRDNPALLHPTLELQLLRETGEDLVQSKAISNDEKRLIDLVVAWATLDNAYFHRFRKVRRHYNMKLQKNGVEW